MNVYQALLRDGAEKRAKAAETKPTVNDVWHALRKLYGPSLMSATLVTVTECGGIMTVQTTTIPATQKAAP